jgi:hypothetical protein
MQTRQPTLKPQDLLVAVALALPSDERFSYGALSSRLHLSTSEVHAAVRRADLSRLVMSGPASPPLAARGALLEFLLHGVRYAFPALQGSLTSGVPTGLAAVRDVAVGSVDAEAIPPVWPHPAGTQRGYGLVPLYPTVPDACLRDRALHEVVALIDALRMGATREREIAASLLRQRLQAQ